ncbi:universal stress protein [Terricaulis sp.]|uniref:universal stress protein n=1 Tax=Terricaulis sp. TaxID=2768686 RepID=UPI00378323E1
MSWRDFLVFADASEDGFTRLGMAQEIAAAHEGHLEALVLTPMQVPMSVLPEAASAAYTQAEAAARDASASVVRALQAKYAPGPKLSIYSCEAPANATRNAAGRAARTADLVVLGQPVTFDNSELDTDIYRGAVLLGGRPCLMLPRWEQRHDFGKRILISWKATPQSARAVEGALPFLTKADKVRVCVANPRGEREGEGERSLERLATYLMRHGVKVEQTITRESWEGPERMIISEIEGFSADMLVMGAYEGAQFAEDIFNGVTPTVVRDSNVPILLAH